MKFQIRTLAATAAIVVATAAFAHDGVKNPTVKARMDSMAKISTNLKTIGKMAQGKTEFDAEAAQAALDAIAKQAGETENYFIEPETDPKSEALPTIWTNWEDFVAKAEALEIAANAVDTSSKMGLGQGLKALGGSCKGCHAEYRS